MNIIKVALSHFCCRTTVQSDSVSVSSQAGDSSSLVDSMKHIVSQPERTNGTEQSSVPVRHISRKLELGGVIKYWGVPSLPLPSLPFPSPSLCSPPFPPLPLPSHIPSPSFRSRPPLIQLEGLGERCELPQRGLGRSPSRNRIWCIIFLKSDIWWQQC